MTNKILLAIGILAFVIGGVLLLVEYPSAPTQIPTHYGLSGKADVWGNKEYLIFSYIVYMILAGSLCYIYYRPEVGNPRISKDDPNKEELIAIKRRMISIIFALISVGMMWINSIMLYSVDTLPQLPFFLWIGSIIAVSIWGTFGLYKRRKA